METCSASHRAENGQVPRKSAPMHIQGCNMRWNISRERLFGRGDAQVRKTNPIFSSFLNGLLWTPDKRAAFWFFYFGRRCSRSPGGWFGVHPKRDFAGALLFRALGNHVAGANPDLVHAWMSTIPISPRRSPGE